MARSGFKLLLLLVACFIAGILARGLWPGGPAPKRAAEKNRADEPVPGAAGLDGASLARRYCVTCHLVPEPELLTRSQWMHQIMPQMALWLGMEPVNYGSVKDGKLLEGQGVFPEGPALSEEEWFAIWDYYRTRAPSEALKGEAPPPARDGLTLFTPRKLNFHAGAPMMSLVRIESRKLIVGDGYAGVFASVDPQGQVIHKMRIGSGPVSMVARDDGAFVVLIGRMFPSDVPEGQVVFVPEGSQEPVPVLENLRRPTHLSVADLDGDGADDLLVCSFGNRLGHFAWYRNEGGGRYQEHVLINAPGAIRSAVHDFNADGRPDVMVQMAQAREAIYILYNEGEGRFQTQTVVEQHPLFGYADFQLVDFNQDGRMDLLTVNGDNGDNPAPGKRYHGIRLYLDKGGNRFEEAWFHPLEGAYKAMPADFDGDGDVDLAVISYYPDWRHPVAGTALYLDNRGDGRFESFLLPGSDAGRWITMDAGDLDGDGDVDLALGSFSRGPVTIPIPEAVEEEWRRNGAAVLVLENTTR